MSKLKWGVQKIGHGMQIWHLSRGKQYVIVKMRVIGSLNRSRHKKTSTKHVRNWAATLYIKIPLQWWTPFMTQWMTPLMVWIVSESSISMNMIWDALYGSWTKLDIWHIFLRMPYISYININVIDVFYWIVCFPIKL